MGIKRKDTEAQKLKRTGEKSFVVEHDDGSKFECVANSKEQLDYAASKAGDGKKLFMLGGIGKRKPLVCDECNKRVHKISVVDGRSLCGQCV